MFFERQASVCSYLVAWDEVHTNTKCDTMIPFAVKLRRAAYSETGMESIRVHDAYAISLRNKYTDRSFLSLHVCTVGGSSTLRV